MDLESRYLIDQNTLEDTYVYLTFESKVNHDGFPKSFANDDQFFFEQTRKMKDF
jgi:hypothetical protein